MSTLLETPPASSRGKPTCRHCGAPSPAGEFCCAGCAYVYRLVHDEGLSAYYRLKEEVTVPAELAVADPRDFSWLKVAQQEAEAKAGERLPELALDIQGISCAGCVWLIERLFQREAGAGRIDLNAQTGQVRMSWVPGRFEASGFAVTLQRFNYLLGPASAERGRQGESRGLVKRIGLTAAFAMNIMLFALPAYFGMEPGHAYAHLFTTLSFGFATLSVLVGGGYFFARALGSLRAGLMSIDLPIALGIIGAYGGSTIGWLVGREEYVYFDFVGTFVVLMLTGRWAQVAAVERNQRQLLGQQPVGAPLLLRRGTAPARLARPEDLLEGDELELKVGQTVPVAAVLRTAEVEVSLAWINGESAPRWLRTGQAVPAGAQVLSRAGATVVAREGWEQSLLRELLRPRERADYRHRFIEKVIQGYLVAILSLAALAGAGWWWATGDLLRTGAVVTAILVVSCPCAIGLAFPLADEIATVALRRWGVFVRAHDLWPRLARVRRLWFDKTGTLTLEIPQLKEEERLKELTPEARSALATLVLENPHPVARALAEGLWRTGPVEARAVSVVETVGYGVECEWAGTAWSLGRPGWRTAIGVGPSGSVVLAENGIVRGVFEFAETVRQEAEEALGRLRGRGLQLGILSGDSREKVDTLVRRLGLEAGAGWGELSPQAKAARVAAEEPETALMLGDGANDSLAFDQALCRGTPVVHRGLLEQKADFYYLGNSLLGLARLFIIDDVRRATQRALLIFSIGYNLLAVGLAITGHMNPLLAAILMPLSSLASLAIVGVGMRSAWRGAAAAPQRA